MQVDILALSNNLGTLYIDPDAIDVVMPVAQTPRNYTNSKARVVLHSGLSFYVLDTVDNILQLLGQRADAMQKRAAR